MSMPDAPARCRESTSSSLQDGSWDLHEVQQRVAACGTRIASQALQQAA